MNDSVKIDAMNELFDLYESYSPDSNLFYAQKVLQIGLDKKINSVEAFGYTEVGYSFSVRPGSCPVEISTIKIIRGRPRD